MKRKLWIILAMAVLFAALGAGAALAAGELTFTQEPSVGQMDVENLTYPVSWTTGFKPVRVEIYDADVTEIGQWKLKYTGDEIQQSMTREFGPSWWGQRYIVRAYYYYSSYYHEDCKYVDSQPYTLSTAHTALSFTAQPTVGKLDAENLSYPISWTTGFKPVRVEIYDTDDTEIGQWKTYYTGDEIQRSMTREFGPSWWGQSYIVRAFYYYSSYYHEDCKYVDSQPYTLSTAHPALSFTAQPKVGGLNAENLTYSVSWTTGFKPVRVEIYDADNTEIGQWKTYYTGEDIQQSMTQEYGPSWWGQSYIVRAYYYYSSYYHEDCKYVDSQPFSLAIITVTFDAGGGVGSMSSVGLMEDEPYTLPECGFTRPYHVFYKWQIGTEYYDPGDIVTFTESVTVRAVWKKTYTITFSPGSGSGAGGTMEPLTVPVNEEFTLPECSFTPPEGKIFSRWGASGDRYYKPGDTLVATSNHLFVAQWRSDRTTVGFDRNGGTGSMNPVSLTPAQASEYELPACTFAPPADCIFEKWQVIKQESGDTYYAVPGDLSYLSGCINVKLKAIWAPKPSYEITFNANGHGTAPLPQSVMQDKYAVDPGPLSAEGYTFLGWYTEAAGTNRFNFATTKITGPITLYARWIDTIRSIEINGFVFPAAGMRSVSAAQISTGNMGYVCTRIEWRVPSTSAGSGYSVSYTPITFVPNTEYTAVITLETVRNILFDNGEAPELVTINGETTGVDLARSGYVSATKYQLYTVPVVTENMVPIDEAHFPDETFCSFLQGRNYDSNGDGFFSLTEISAITSLNVSNKGIASLQGIGILDELKTLNAVGNALTSLDLSNNWKLEEVYCSGNTNLAELSLSKGNWLKKLQCYRCALTWLDVRGITYLALAAAETPVVSPNGQDKTYSYYLNSVKVSEIIADAGVTLYSDSTSCARVRFEPGLGTGTMPSVMASKATGAYYTLPANGFTAPENMYFTGWLLSSTGETFSAGETMNRTFAADEHEITFIAQWTSAAVLTITVPDATKAVSAGGFPVILSYIGSGNVEGGKWLSSYSSTAVTDNVTADRLYPNTTYYAAILFPANVSISDLRNQITEGRLAVKNADVVNGVRYQTGSSYRTFLIVSVQPRTVNVDFMSGGGSGIMMPVTGKVPGTKYILPPCDYTAPADMVFDQWSLGAPGTAITLDDDAVLIARWKAEDGAIPVTADYFPDDAFRMFVSENLDVNGGGYLTASEIANVLTLSCSSNDIESFAGIEYLTELEELDCQDNSLTELDLSANTKLGYLECQGTGIASLSLDTLSNLYYLDCSDNSLSRLDVSEQQLESLYCQGNPLASLRLSEQAALKTLYCFDTELDTLDLRDCPLLLDCLRNGTRTITASYVEYRIDSTHALRVAPDTELIIPGMIAVDAANFPDDSFRLWVSDTADRNGSGWLSQDEIDMIDAIYLNVPAFTDLASVQGIEYFTESTELIIEGTPNLTAIDLAENAKIESLEITNTGLTSLYVSGLPLQYLDCRNNAMTSLTLGSQPGLEELHCCGNPGLIVLDLRNAPNLLDAVLNGTKSVQDGGDLYTGLLGGKLHADANTEIIVPGMIPVDAAHFPDPFFCDYVGENFDTNDSGWLSGEEIAAVTSISMDSFDGLQGVTGIQYFTELDDLSLTNNPSLSGVDLSHNTKLTYVDLESNSLTGIQLNGLTALRQLYLHHNRLEALDVSALSALEYLDCETNPLNSLTLGESSSLKILCCYGTNLTSLDISGVPRLVAAWLGTKDGSRPQFDRYTADGCSLDVDKGISIITGIPAPTFTLPAFLTAIEEEAFSGIAAEAVLIPANVNSISGDPFRGSQVRYIYGTPGTAAETFAKANGYIFVPERE